MIFLRTLFWVVVAVFVTMFAYANWHDVTLNLWGDLQLDIKLPLLVGLFFLVGFVPLYLVMRARLWTLRRRLDAFERERAGAVVPAVPHAAPAADPAPDDIATVS